MLHTPHEDHFGALFDLWPKLKVPVYATPFTAALIEAKRAGEPGAPDIDVKVIPLGGRFNAGPFDIEFVSMAHSIPNRDRADPAHAARQCRHTRRLRSSIRHPLLVCRPTDS